MLNTILRQPAIHQKFARAPQDTLKVFDIALVLDYDAHPWEALFRQFAVEHQLYDDFWEQRNLSTHIGSIDIPMYLGADWENVGLHLEAPFIAMEQFSPNSRWRVMMGPRGSLQWPWESFHIEALAWYDHWLKGQDTGIGEGAPIRYYLEGADEWYAADTWPLPETQWVDLFLSANGKLTPHEPVDAAAQTYEFMLSIVSRAKNTRPGTLPRQLTWETLPFTQNMDLMGPIVLHLEASSTAPDTDWIVKLYPMGRLMI